VADGVFGVEVVTPEQPLVAGGTTAVVLKTSEGDLTVLDGHTALVSDVAICEVKVAQEDGTTLRLAVHGGFMEVDTSPGAAVGFAEGDGPLAGLSTKVTILAGVAELASAIDVPRALAAKEAAEQRVSDLTSGRGAPVDSGGGSDSPEVPLIEAEQALARAELRLAVAAGSTE
jgi:F-type H+-transporting ATPase subunit epsilon